MLNHQNALIERLFKEVKEVVLSRQHPVTGLLPASTAITHHGNYTDAWVRDNVYSIMCVWCLGTALHKRGEAHRADVLEQSTIKLMRGLLQAMMRQAPKVERFKRTLEKQDALHAKYDTATGLPVVADDAWGHLQIDATSLFLLMLAQMTSQGLRIVRTLDEVDFVQNLVYYISSAYRIPDFGIWERGNKINNGETEINASSVGMAKAALQALDGFNLFGPDGHPRAVIHVVVDSVSLARSTLSTMLPRESISKEVDAALLSVIGFPAFAVSQDLADKTNDKIKDKLGGKYGCKRFLWDGHQTAIEDGSRLYYEHTELSNFEHIESEWPLFYCYMFLNALFDDNEAEIQRYEAKLSSLAIERDGFKLLPELFYVAQENIAKEKAVPHSQPRLPNENVPLVWAQSLYICGTLLREGLIQKTDIDPLHLHKRNRRAVKPQIGLVVVAKDAAVKEQLSNAGVVAETIQEIAPIRVLSALDMLSVYSHIGENKLLGLTGRPLRRLQSLATSHTFEINDRRCLCLSWLQSEFNDYRSLDAQNVCDTITSELEFLHTHWHGGGVAVFTLYIDDAMCEMPNVHIFLNMLRQLQLRTQFDYVGYASAKLAYKASRTSKFKIPDYELPQGLDNLSMYMHEEPVSQELWQAFTVQNNLQGLIEDNQCNDFSMYQRWTEWSAKRDLADKVTVSLNEHEQSEVSVKQLVEYVYLCASRTNHWLLARHCFAELNYTHLDLADCTNMLVAKNLQITFGNHPDSDYVLKNAVSNEELSRILQELINDPVEQTLMQEMLSIIGLLLRYEPKVFYGLRSVNLHNLLMLCLENVDGDDRGSKVEQVGFQSPNSLLMRLRYILEQQAETFQQGSQSFMDLLDDDKHDISSTKAMEINAMDASWFEWRMARGSLTHLDEVFLQAIWDSLSRAKVLILGDADDLRVDCEFILSSMTPGESSFALTIDAVIQQLHPAYYKCVVLEALMAFIDVTQENKDIVFTKPLHLGQVLERSAKMFADEQPEICHGRQRNIDALMEQSPQLVHRLAKEAVLSMHQEQSSA